MSEQAQHLVALSMNKIQSARGKKAGLNLHRSLLVSTVLFKAKTAIIMAKYNMKCDYQITADDTSDAEEYDDDSDDDQQVPDIDTDSESYDTTDSSEPDICDLDNKENSAPIVASTAEWRENNVLSSSSNATGESNQDIKCNKCVKRRLTEVECAVESITNKRQCTESDGVQSSESDRQAAAQEPMDCAQVSTLVDSFHCGFSGLLTENQSLNSGGGGSTASANQGLSDAFSTCSTQIKDALAVTQPIMLSV